MSSPITNSPDVLGSGTLSIALIGPADLRREPIVSALKTLHGAATREFSSYPDLDDVPKLVEGDYDVIIVELDSNPEHALDLVESICSGGSVTVMVYSEQVYLGDAGASCMRAGAREFLTHSGDVELMDCRSGMVRVAVRRPATHVDEKG